MLYKPAEFWFIDTFKHRAIIVSTKVDSRLITGV